MILHRTTALLLVVLLSACDAQAGIFPTQPEPPSPEPSPVRLGESVQTDSLRYAAVYVGGQNPHRRYGFTVVSTYMNRTTQTLYLQRCDPDSPHPLYGVQSMGPAGSGAAAYSQVWACVGHTNQIAVTPGATRVDTLQITGPNSRNGLPPHEPYGELEGRFRLRYNVHTCAGDGYCPAPDSLQISNVFEVRLQR